MRQAEARRAPQEQLSTGRQRPLARADSSEHSTAGQRCATTMVPGWIGMAQWRWQLNRGRDPAVTTVKQIRTMRKKRHGSLDNNGLSPQRQQQRAMAQGRVRLVVGATADQRGRVKIRAAAHRRDASNPERAGAASGRNDLATPRGGVDRSILFCREILICFRLPFPRL